MAEENKRRKKKSTEVGRIGNETGRRWPIIKPKKDLKIVSLKHSFLFTIPNFLTAAEAMAFVEAAESIGFIHQGSGGPAKGEAFRDNDRISVSDQSLAQRLWEVGLKTIFDVVKLPGKVAVGLNPNIRFYRYKEGQRFGRHIDESADLGDGRSTEYTLLIYLSGNGSNHDASGTTLVGGETVFYDQRQKVVAEVAPVQGTALLHIHGYRCMLHEARVVTKGIKYVLRSDIAFA